METPVIVETPVIIPKIIEPEPIDSIAPIFEVSAAPVEIVPATGGTTVVEEGIPDWIKNTQTPLEASETLSSSPTNTSSDAEKLPDWLINSLDPQLPEEEIKTESIGLPSSVDLGMPTPLIETESIEPIAIELPKKTPKKSPAKKKEISTPKIPSEKVSNDENIPDWLK